MAVVRVPVEDDEGRSVWPEKFTAKELAVRKENLGELRYAQEYLVTPVSLFGAQLSLDWLTLYDYNRCWEDGVFEEGEYYFGVDPSVSGKGDYMAICVIYKSFGKEGRPSKVYLVDFVREKAQLDRMVELIERTASIYPPKIIQVEAIQAQQLLVQNLVDRTPLPVRGYYPKGKKEDRIAVMAQVHFSTSRILVRGKMDEYRGLIFAENMQPFVQEWLSFPRGQHDDTLDAAEAALECVTSFGQAVSLSSETLVTEEEKRERVLTKARRRLLW